MAEILDFVESQIAKHGPEPNTLPRILRTLCLQSLVESGIK